MKRNMSNRLQIIERRKAWLLLPIPIGLSSHGAPTSRAQQKAGAWPDVDFFAQKDAAVVPLAQGLALGRCAGWQSDLTVGSPALPDRSLTALATLQRDELVELPPFSKPGISCGAHLVIGVSATTVPARRRLRIGLRFVARCSGAIRLMLLVLAPRQGQPARNTVTNRLLQVGSLRLAQFALAMHSPMQ